jgi:hypothetical protein
VLLVPVELANVGAGDKRTPGTQEDNRANVVVPVGSLHRTDQAVAHRVRQRIDRRVIDTDDRNAVLA